MHVAFLVVLIVLIAVPAAVAASRVARLRRPAAVAVLQDAAPVVLGLSWVGVGLAAATGHWWLAALGLVVGGYHVVLLARSARPARAPRWVPGAPTVRVAVANVYVDNDEIDVAAAQLATLDADVVIVVESTPAFRVAFDAAGGEHTFPHRTFDPHDRSDYAVSLYSRSRPLSMGTTSIGALPAATAVLDTGRGSVEVVGVIPKAAVDPGGYDAWQREIHALTLFARRHQGPLVVAGDLNTTVHRVAFDDIRAAGLHDAHEALGEGTHPSFALAATGVLSRIGPLVRLDHALCNASVWPVEAHDLERAGSDHRPFVVTVAVRPTRRRGARPTRLAVTTDGYHHRDPEPVARIPRSAP